MSDQFISNITTLVQALNQRDLSVEQEERYAQALQAGERHLLHRPQPVGREVVARWGSFHDVGCAGPSDCSCRPIVLTRKP